MSARNVLQHRISRGTASRPPNIQSEDLGAEIAFDHAQRLAITKPGELVRMTGGRGKSDRCVDMSFYFAVPTK
jgi:hypothetical protein